MTLYIQLTSEQEARLQAAASQEGIAPELLATKLIADHLPPITRQIADPTLALFAQWAQEDALKSPEEIAKEDRLWEAFEQGVNETRHAQGMRLL